MRIFKVEFKLNHFKACERFFKWADNCFSKEDYVIDNFPMKWRVNMAYYKGRFFMYKHEFQIAKEELSFAFQHCHKDYGKNKKKILRYLVPVQMNFNVFPE